LHALLEAIDDRLSQPAASKVAYGSDVTNLQAVLDFYQELMAGDLS